MTALQPINVVSKTIVFEMAQRIVGGVLKI